jgi:hypothetical protein
VSIRFWPPGSPSISFFLKKCKGAIVAGLLVGENGISKHMPQGKHNSRRSKGEQEKAIIHKDPGL